ncbi:amino acid ABC transporter permease [Vagococcus elongatus]|nr:amino acid ABC transporter permease [Vagococcus elongatus]
MLLVGFISFLNTGPFALFRWEALFKDLPVFMKSFGYTIVLSIGAILLAFIIGLLFGIVSQAKNPVTRGLVRIYVEFFQNTPLLIQVFFVYYGLPLVGVVMPVYLIGIICVGLYHGAYISEVVRSGIGSIPRGQLEAAMSQGFTYWKAMGYVVLPQAWRVMLPPLTNQAVNLIKNTSVIAIISGADIMFTANSWSSVNLHYIPAFAFAAILYFILCFPLASVARKLEEKNKKLYSK